MATNHEISFDVERLGSDLTLYRLSISSEDTTEKEKRNHIAFGLRRSGGTGKVVAAPGYEDLQIVFLKMFEKHYSDSKWILVE